MKRSLFVLALLYGGMTCIAGVLGNKLVAIGPLGVEAGIFAFLPLVAISSAVAEAHGRAAADSLVRWGFLPLVAAILLIRFVLALPPAPFMEPERVAAFDRVLGQSSRLMFAGMIAYGVSQSLNVAVFTRLRQGTRLMWLRAGVAGVLSQAVDTVLFITIAFWGVAPIDRILPGQLLAKVVLSALVVPLAIELLAAATRALDRER